MCRTGCKTQNHASWGDCLRAARLNIGDGVYESRRSSRMSHKDWDSELSAFRDAAKQGIMPDGTKLHQTRKAVQLSDEYGTAYKGQGETAFRTVHGPKGAEFKEATTAVKKDNGL